MKVRWLVISLLLVIVSAVAAVVFSSQGSEVSNGLSKGILYRLLEFFGIEITAESVKLGNFLIRKAAHFTVYFVLGLGLAGAFHFQKKVPAWVPAILLGVAFAASDEFHQSFTDVLPWCGTWCWIPAAWRRDAWLPVPCGEGKKRTSLRIFFYG